jgi:hypothetical protein
MVDTKKRKYNISQIIGFLSQADAYILVQDNKVFGVLAWDANQNRYVMLDPTNQQAAAGSVSGNMPML